MIQFHMFFTCEITREIFVRGIGCDTSRNNEIPRSNSWNLTRKHFARLSSLKGMIYL